MIVGRNAETYPNLARLYEPEFSATDTELFEDFLIDVNGPKSGWSKELCDNFRNPFFKFNWLTIYSPNSLKLVNAREKFIEKRLKEIEAQKKAIEKQEEKVRQEEINLRHEEIKLEKLKGQYKEPEFDNFHIHHRYMGK
jgi:hypothetical protein